MSTRSQVLIKSKDIPDIYLYKHHDGYDTPLFVREALKGYQHSQLFDLHNTQQIAQRILIQLIVMSNHSLDDMYEECLEGKRGLDVYQLNYDGTDDVDSRDGRFAIDTVLHDDTQVLVTIDLVHDTVTILYDHVHFDGVATFNFDSIPQFIDSQYICN